MRLVARSGRFHRHGDTNESEQNWVQEGYFWEVHCVSISVAYLEREMLSGQSGIARGLLQLWKLPTEMESSEVTMISRLIISAVFFPA